MSSPPPLIPGVYYHIFNRGNNREVVFREERNYFYFLTLYAKYIGPVADTLAYCLMSNHFHFLLRLLTEEEQKQWAITNEALEDTDPELNDWQPKSPSRQFSHFFNAYAKAFNKMYGRTGSLFEHPFGRIPVTSDSYLRNLVVYIHQNPRKHAFADDFRTWPFSSYRAILSDQPTKVNRAHVLGWFDHSRERFAASHDVMHASMPILPAMWDKFRDL